VLLLNLPGLLRRSATASRAAVNLANTVSKSRWASERQGKEGHQYGSVFARLLRVRESNVYEISSS
jgi:hypothetical protein